MLTMVVSEWWGYCCFISFLFILFCTDKTFITQKEVILRKSEKNSKRTNNNNNKI